MLYNVKTQIDVIQDNSLRVNSKIQVKENVGQLVPSVLDLI